MKEGGGFPFGVSRSMVCALGMGIVLLCVGVMWNRVPIGSEEQEYKRNAVIFNFGDSNSDTGGLAAGLGYNVTLPNGRTFFRRSTGRLSDGRLVLDFLCESLNTSFLSPYLDSLGSDFTNGANFAIVGSATLPKKVPFALDVQLRQFLHFKSRSLQLKTSQSQGSSRGLVDNEGFLNALYMIDIGQNDISHLFAKNLSYDQVTQSIPSILKQIKYAVRTLYEQGGKNFWIHNTGPLGCLPQKLSLVRRTVEDIDQYGCISSYNNAAKLFNGGLSALCEEMRSELANATIVYVDMYSIKYDIIANSTKYGFENPLMACCGYGGPPYNYDIHMACGHSGCDVCNEGKRFVSWDGIHYTEAANAVIASKILSTAYSTPQLKFNFFAKPDDHLPNLN